MVAAYMDLHHCCYSAWCFDLLVAEIGGSHFVSFVGVLGLEHSWHRNRRWKVAVGVFHTDGLGWNSLMESCCSACAMTHKAVIITTATISSIPCKPLSYYLHDLN